MATLTMILFIGMLSFVITPLIGSLNNLNPHKTDLMAGDEGE